MSCCVKVSNLRLNNKGIALYFVLAILLVVVILANIILTFITSQTRLTGHQVKRIQAYYAGQAGMNYALEMLRNNTSGWMTGTSDTFIHRLCSDHMVPPPPPSYCDYVESSFPGSVNYVEITIGPLDTVNQTRTINTTVNYTSSY